MARHQFATALCLAVCGNFYLLTLPSYSDSLPKPSSDRSDITTDRSQARQDEQDLETKLKNIAGSAHHLQKTVHEIIFEITRQEYVNASEPEVVGPIVIPATPPPAGVIAMSGFFPPRKKYIDFYSCEEKNLFTMFSEEVSALPDVCADANINTQIASLKKNVSDLQNTNDLLQKSMIGPKYDNLSIGKMAIKISDQLDQIQTLLKTSDKELRTDIKND